MWYCSNLINENNLPLSTKKSWWCFVAGKKTVKIHTTRFNVLQVFVAPLW